MQQRIGAGSFTMEESAPVFFDDGVAITGMSIVRDHMI
jgi:hypothetical protein